MHGRGARRSAPDADSTLGHLHVMRPSEVDSALPFPNLMERDYAALNKRALTSVRDRTVRRLAVYSSNG